MKQQSGRLKQADKRVAKPSRQRGVAKKLSTPVEVELAQLMALLHADRWLFEAAELAARGGAEDETARYTAIRFSIAECLTHLQPRAYGALMRGGQAKAVLATAAGKSRNGRGRAQAVR